jgi:hypothetical protein
MANTGTFGTILAEIGKGLLPLSEAVSSPDRFIYFMQKLGWQADSIPQPLQNLGASVETLFAALRAIVGDGLALDGSVSLGSDTALPSVALGDIDAVAHAVVQVVNAIRNLENAPDAGFPATLLDDGFKAKFPQQLIDFLLVNYFTRYQSTWAFALRALGVIKTKYVPRTGNRLPFVQYSFDFSDLPNVFSNPTLVLQNAYAWGTDDFDFATFSSQVDNLLWHLGLDTSVEEIPLDVASTLEGNVSVPGDPARRAIKAIFFERARATGRMSADVRMLYLPADTGKKPGFAIMPAFNGMTDFTFQLSPDIAVTITSDMDLQGGIGLLFRPDTSAEMLLGFNNNAVTRASGSIQVTVDRSQLDNSPILLLGSPDSTRLQYQKLGGLLGIRLDANQSPDIFAEADLKGLSFVFSSSGADGFIQKILPSGDPSLSFDLTAGISHKNGFYFRGTSHLEISVPAHIQLGPIDIQSLTISANPKDGTLPVSVGASFDAALGPLTASIDNIGLTATFSFPSGGGNLGPLDLALGFKPPNGVGLSVDAGPVKGGGFLYIDTDRGEYAGALQLVFSDFLGLSAIGLITTKMPDGSAGFSLLIIITADFGAGIQLGFGFTLLAVGGLLGLNRAMLFQPLMDGIRTNAIQSIMFPQDVVANATRILSDLRAIFPPQEGTFLIGPMAKLGWGEPTLIQHLTRRHHRNPARRRSDSRNPESGAARRRHPDFVVAGQLRRRSGIRQAAALLLRLSVRFTHPVHHHRRRDGRVGGIWCRFEPRHLGRRFPSAVQSAPAAVHSSQENRTRHHQRGVCANPLQRLFRSHFKYGPIRLALRIFLRFQRTQRARQLWLRRADPVFAIPLHCGNLDVILRECVRARRLLHRHRSDA